MCLKTKYTYYQNHGHHGNLSLQVKISMLEPGILPGTSWLVVRDPDHEAGRKLLIIRIDVKNYFINFTVILHYSFVIIKYKVTVILELKLSKAFSIAT